MSDDLHRFYVRWDGLTHKGTIKIGPFKYDFDRWPWAFKAFDIFYEPPVQLELRELVGGEKREMYQAEVTNIADWVRPIGAIVRQLKDVIESR